MIGNEANRMKQFNVELFPNLNHEVVKDITGFKLCTYLVALEGWRRGLTLKWYKDESDLCKLDKLKSSTQGKFFSLSNGNKEHFFFRSRGDIVLNKTVRICQDKEKTKALLDKKNVPIPLGKVVSIDDGRTIEYAESFDYPVVIKPINGSMGRGVYTNIKNRNEFISALKDFRSLNKYSQYLLEKYYPGKEYRVYVVGDNVIGATNRIPANITGDGKNTIEFLIKKKNQERKKNPYLAPKPIKIDYEVLHNLKKYNYEPTDIPKDGERVFLREKSNLSAGGDPIEATHELSPEVCQIAVDALKALPSIPHGGVDIIVDPLEKKKGVVLEINATAEIGFHLYPLKGKAKDIPGAIIDYYFPETITKQKSSFYFDYHSVLEPLKTWAVDELTVAKAPVKKVYAKKYTVQGKVQQVGYMSWIRKRALQKQLHGFAQKKDRDKIEVTVISNDKTKLDMFREECTKGSKKSKVHHVEEQDINISEYTPVKLGFDIVLSK